MDEYKICFITSVNDMERYNESLSFWSKLSVPAGIGVDFVVITGASSMVEAYQAGMEQSNAKYKIYIHQDVWIKEENFLHVMMHSFQSDRDIGIAGVIGSRYLPRSLAWWESNEKLGAVCDNHLGDMQPYFYECRHDMCQDAAALDGLILITQYDLPWRTDIFDDWHFYDTSQCMEFHRAGLKVSVLPTLHQKAAIWHWCGQKILPLAYHEAQKKFIQEYGAEVVINWFKE